MYLRKLLLKCFDCIFPPHDTTLRVRNITPEKMRTLYALHTMDEVRTLSSYQDHDIRALVHEAKFYGNTEAHGLLNVLFKTYLDATNVTVDLIIPIPLSSTRMRERGYNQVLAILNGGSKKYMVPILTDVLIRTRDTRPQTELGRAERLLNMRDAFGVAHGEKITGKHILLIDDVTTTGTTLKTAKAELEKYSPASITMVAFTH